MYVENRKEGRKGGRRYVYFGGCWMRVCTLEGRRRGRREYHVLHMGNPPQARTDRPTHPPTHIHVHTHTFTHTHTNTIYI
jgi:hypothetical protein